MQSHKANSGTVPGGCGSRGVPAQNNYEFTGTVLRPVIQSLVAITDKAALRHVMYRGSACWKPVKRKEKREIVCVEMSFVILSLATRQI
jgi:hypothetical protein